MCGCSMRATRCASASKRRMNSGCEASSERICLMATSRSTDGWMAFHTTENAPLPISSSNR